MWGLLSVVLLAVGTALTVVGSQRGVALIVLAGVAVIVLGLVLLRPLAQSILDWLDQRDL